jgi:hypothetical protein
MNFIKSVRTSLEGPFHNAIKLLSDNDSTNDKDVCNKLKLLHKTGKFKTKERVTIISASGGPKRPSYSYPEQSRILMCESISFKVF